MTRLATPERARRPAATGTPGAIAVERHTRNPAAIAARLVAGGLVIATGAIHLYLYRSGFSGIPTIGRLFLANFIVALVLGALVIFRSSPWWSGLGAVFCVATLGGFLISVQWGLFGYQETLHGTWQTRAAAVEVAGAVAGAVAAVLASRPGSPDRPPRSTGTAA